MKKLLFSIISIISFLSFTPFAHAAIARDSSSGNIGNVGDTTLTCTQTVSGSNRIIFATFSWAGNPITVTDNGVAMTQIGGYVDTDLSRYSSTWYLINPPTGSNAVEEMGSNTGLRPQCTTASYTGVDQINPINANMDVGTPSTSITGTVVTTVNNCWAIFGVENRATSAAGTNATLNNTSGDHNFIYDNSTFGPIPTGSFSMTVTDTGTAAATVGNFIAFEPVQPIIPILNKQDLILF